MKRLSKYIFGKLPATSKNVSDKMAEKISHWIIHDQEKYPHIRSLEYCRHCQLGMCYMWSNTHFDMHHSIDWGYDIFKFIQPPENEITELFNSGYRTIFDIEKLKWPWGNSIKKSKYSTMWAVWGSWTCSSHCHDEFIQSKGKCVFIRNFVDWDETKHIQGMRHIMLLNILAMHKDGKKEHTPCARVSNKFMKATLGPHKNTVTIQRGFRQYGQPWKETLEGIIELIDKDDDLPFEYNKERLCLCECEYCKNSSPHSVFNCGFQWLARPELSDKNKKEMGLQETWEWSWYEWFGMPTHKLSDWMLFWLTSKFRKIDL